MQILLVLSRILKFILLEDGTASHLVTEHKATDKALARIRGVDTGASQPSPRRDLVPITTWMSPS